MLYNTATPSLVSYTRDLAGDPASASSELWADARVQAAVNDAYLELREEARMLGGGAEVKRTYATSVADQLWYQLPADFKKMVLCEVSTDGSDLSGTGTPQVLDPLALDVALEGWETGAFTSPKYVAMGDTHFAVVAPVDTGGSSSIRITYEAETPALSAVGDEPVLPEPHQYLICYKAAVSLRASENLEHDALMRLMLMKERAFRIAMQERLDDPEGQLVVTGLIENSQSSTQFGRLVRKS